MYNIRSIEESIRETFKNLNEKEIKKYKRSFFKVKKDFLSYLDSLLKSFNSEDKCIIKRNFEFRGHNKNITAYIFIIKKEKDDYILKYDHFEYIEGHYHREGYYHRELDFYKIENGCIVEIVNHNKGDTSGYLSWDTPKWVTDEDDRNFFKKYKARKFDLSGSIEYKNFKFPTTEHDKILYQKHLTSL